MALNWTTYCAHLLFNFAEQIQPCDVQFEIIHKPYGCRIGMAIKHAGAEHCIVRISFRIASDEDVDYFKWFLNLFRQLDLHVHVVESD